MSHFGWKFKQVAVAAMWDSRNGFAETLSTNIIR